MARKSSLAADAAPRCTACGSEHIEKNGKNVCGHQQFRCRACGACRVLHPKSRETAPERKDEVLRAVATERLSCGRRSVFSAWPGTRSRAGSKKSRKLPAAE